MFTFYATHLGYKMQYLTDENKYFVRTGDFYVSFSGNKKQEKTKSP